MRTFDERDQRLLVVGDGEILHVEITVGFVVRVPVAGEVIGSYRHTADGKVCPYLGEEEFFEDFFTDCRVEFTQRDPAQFVETGTEAVYLLEFLSGMDNGVDVGNGIYRGRYQVGTFHPLIIFGRCHPRCTRLDSTGRKT